MSGRPKYLDDLLTSLDRMSDLLTKKTTWLVIHCGVEREEMHDVLSAARRLATAADELCEELTPRGRRKR